MNYNLQVDDEGKGSISFVADGILLTYPHTHPCFTRVTHALVHGLDPTPYLRAESALLGFDPRVTTKESDGRIVVEFDGKPVNGKLLNTISRYQAEGRDYTGIVKFLERLMSNPSKQVRDNLFDWASAKDLTITEDGFFIGWKGVKDRAVDVEQPGYSYPYQSSNAGHAFVDGVEYGASRDEDGGDLIHEVIPYGVGCVVTMPREECDDNQYNSCSTGLHVGSYGYAKTFATHVLEVKVDPADVLAVPRSETGKLRCCRFEVVAVQERPTSNLRRWEAEATFDEEGVLEETLAAAQVPNRFRDRIKRVLGLGAGRSRWSDGDDEDDE